MKKHMELIAEKQHLDESSKDPSRLTQRGAQAAGRLLQEEKVRKKLAKELPKVKPSFALYLTLQTAEDLTAVLLAWEDENGEDFLIYGERYLDVLDRLSRLEKATNTRNVQCLSSCN
jgi:Ase1/PRC1/MAP65 family protein